MRKKIISILSAAALIMTGWVMPAFAGGVDLVNLDFEDITYEEFKELSNVTVLEGISGDILGIEEEANGNKAFKIFREDANVKDSSDKAGFTYKLPEAVTSGKINVSFRIKSENEYRSRWSDLGSMITSSGSTKLFLFTHSNWVWGQGTGSAYWYTSINKKGTWVTINYEIDIDNNQYTAWTEIDGVASAKSSAKSCGSGDASAIKFEIGKRNVSWTDSNSGDLFYWVDDIKISVNKLVVESPSISNNAEDVGVLTPLTVKFDTSLDSETVNDKNITVEKNGEKINADISLTEPDTVLIAPEEGLSYNSEYKIKIKRSIASTDKLNMLSDYELTFKTLSIIATDISEGARYTQGYLPEFNETAGITYEYLIAVDGGEYEEYDKSALDKLGKYSLKITASDENGKTQEQIISFEIIGAVEPTAKDVVISGEPVTGTILTASYIYNDENDDPEGESIYKWYRSSEKDGNYTEITGANTKEYVLTVEDEDSYIKFGVTPVSSKEPYEGEEVRSEAFTGAMNPKADNVKIEGKTAEGSELSVTYEYFDENGDEENATVITWYVATEKDGTYDVVGTGEKYTLTQKENEHWIKVGVTPKNNGSGTQKREFLSEAVAGAFKPAAQGVQIIGTLKAGSAVGVDYRYIDNNNDPEGNTKIEWYIGGMLKSEKPSLTIESGDKGKQIYVVVTPVSTEAPYEGEPVKSDVKTIASSGSSTVSSGGKNTGSSGGVNVIVPINPDVTENSDKLEQNNNDTNFDDILTHWAKDEITEMAQKGIVKGKAEKVFAPDDNIKRAEFAAIIARAFELAAGECEFSDVSKDDWYYEVISAVFNAGYMKGSDGKFRPNDNITRQEIAVVLSNIAKEKGMESTGKAAEFKDFEKVSSWAKADVDYVISLGFMNGMDSNYFAPLSDATRAQVVVILKRVLEKY